MDHYDFDAADEAKDYTLSLETIPGIEPPTRAVLRAFDLAPVGTAEEVIIYNGGLVWNYHVCGVLSKHPQIGVAGSVANRRFVELFELHHFLRSHDGDIQVMYDLTDFVMIYPPRESVIS